MKLQQSELKGIKFWYRPGFSDIKTFEEVVGRGTYFQRGMKILPGERWMDCGGNVGAFTLLACSLGASVTTYEPDPYNCEMIEKNLKLNGFRATVKQRALVPDNRDTVTLFIGNSNQTWRNSIVKKWNKMGIKVPCARFDDEAKGFHGCKMDIEGAEMPILETTDVVFSKMVYEWSFDIDPSLMRLWNVLDQQLKHYRVEAEWNRVRYHNRDYAQWQPAWFPACTNVFCYEKN